MSALAVGARGPCGLLVSRRSPTLRQANYRLQYLSSATSGAGHRFPRGSGRDAESLREPIRNSGRRTSRTRLLRASPAGGSPVDPLREPAISSSRIVQIHYRHQRSCCSSGRPCNVFRSGEGLYEGPDARPGICARLGVLRSAAVRQAALREARTDPQHSRCMRSRSARWSCPLVGFADAWCAISGENARRERGDRAAHGLDDDDLAWLESRAWAHPCRIRTMKGRASPVWRGRRRQAPAHGASPRCTGRHDRLPAHHLIAEHLPKRAGWCSPPLDSICHRSGRVVRRAVRLVKCARSKPGPAYIGPLPPSRSRRFLLGARTPT